MLYPILPAEAFTAPIGKCNNRKVPNGTFLFVYSPARSFSRAAFSMRLT